MTDEATDDYPAIFLSPRCACDDRTWCNEDQGECEECGTPWTKYVRAALAVAPLIEAKANSAHVIYLSNRVKKLQADLAQARAEIERLHAEHCAHAVCGDHGDMVCTEIERLTADLTQARAAAIEEAGFGALRDANIKRQQEWDAGNQLTLAYRGNELAGEVGEACNVIKKLERERLGIKGSRDTVAHLAEELADVVICVDLIAMSEGVDLWEAVRDKFNATSEKVGLQARLASRPVSEREGEEA